jgi:ribosome-associated protein
MAADTRARDVVVLDVTNLSPVTDFFVIATGTSARQMRSVCDDIVEMAKSTNNKALSTSGFEGESWMLVDFVDVVVHVFGESARAYYDLDGLWGDAPRVEWNVTPPTGAGAP